jgi:lipooligosaccharide transport system permease protein
MRRAVHIVHRNALVYRRMWKSSAVVTVLMPTMYLAAMGLGVGALVDRGPAVLPGGVPYLAFLAPGLMAATCLQSASLEASWPVSGRLLWQRTYAAMHATSLGVADIVVGELGWIALRIGLVALTYSVVSALFIAGTTGAAPSARMLLAVPASVLTGLAMGAPVMAYAFTLTRGQNFNVLHRFIVMPLFLFSGTFFPVSRLPRALQAVALATPLYHGVELSRGLALNTATWLTALGHLAYLGGLAAAGAWLAVRTLREKLQA